jgi:hypothetical protein
VKVNRVSHNILEKAKQFQELFDNRIVAVGSIVDAIAFCLPEDKVRDLDFSFAAENLQKVRDTALALGESWKEYRGSLCGMKYSGIWEGMRVDIFLEPPFTMGQYVVYNGLLCQNTEQRWRMLSMLLTCPKQGKWYDAKKQKIAELINAQEFVL